MRNQSLQLCRRCKTTPTAILIQSYFDIVNPSLRQTIQGTKRHENAICYCYWLCRERGNVTLQIVGVKDHATDRLTRILASEIGKILVSLLLNFLGIVRHSRTTGDAVLSDVVIDQIG